MRRRGIRERRRAGGRKAASLSAPLDCHRADWSWRRPRTSQAHLFSASRLWDRISVARKSAQSKSAPLAAQHGSSVMRADFWDKNIPRWSLDCVLIVRSTVRARQRKSRRASPQVCRLAPTKSTIYSFLFYIYIHIYICIFIYISIYIYTRLWKVEIS